jgi:nucleoside-diphosphate-sugar epimerase
MNILITGGMGFQGRHLARRLLEDGFFVTLLVSNDISKIDADLIFKNNLANDKINVVVGDVRDVILMNHLVETVDVVFHLAGKVSPRESLIQPIEYFKVNFDGTISVLEAVRSHGKKMFYASSCAVYGSASLGAGELFSESYPLLPADPYGASKVAADRACYAYAKSYGLDVVIVRPFSTYGPGQKESPLSGLIPNVVGKASRGEDITIFGDGSAVRDFLYIDDLIDAYVLLLNTGNISGEVFNVGSSKETAVLEVVKIIADKFNVKISYQAPNPAEVKRYASDISKINKLGFEPKFSISKGIESYINSLEA